MRISYRRHCVVRARVDYKESLITSGLLYLVIRFTIAYSTPTTEKTRGHHSNSKRKTIYTITMSTSDKATLLSGAADAKDIEALRAQNSKYGNFPVVQLADGSKVPTGTIGVLLYNIRAYDALQAQDSESDEDQTKLQELESAMKATIPILSQVGLLKLFTPDEWIAEGQTGVSEGRRFVGRCALEHGAGKA